MIILIAAAIGYFGFGIFMFGVVFGSHPELYPDELVRAFFISILFGPIIFTRQYFE